MNDNISVSVLIAVVGLTAIASLGVFFLIWWLWLRKLHQVSESWQDREFDESSLDIPTDHFANAELVHQIRVRTNGRTISVLESDGKRFIRVDGELSRKERAQMMRYLKAEGYMD
ncbi:MAG: hypothetical protein ACAI35_16165 [Candidatus Methylacidiphilales bacterium]|nr:hypothetical protein [Candidatus Methylacidiphilales bacterium]